MMNKKEITALAYSHLRKHLPFDWDFEWNNRKAALGLCCRVKKTFYLSTYFVGRVSDAEIEDTILHEIAHALDWIRNKEWGHGPTWKRICVEIGAKPSRCHSGEVKDQQGRYTVKCPSCSKSFVRHRFNKSKLTQLKNGFSWFPCSCKKSRMDVYEGSKKIVDGNASKRPSPPKVTAKQAKAMTDKELIDHIRKMSKSG